MSRRSVSGQLLEADVGSPVMWGTPKRFGEIALNEHVLQVRERERKIERSMRNQALVVLSPCAS